MTNEKMQEYKKRVEQFINCMSVYDDDMPDEMNDRVVRESYQGAKEAICEFIIEVQTDMIPDFSFAKIYFPDEACMFIYGVKLPEDYFGGVCEEFEVENTEKFEMHLDEMGENPWNLFKNHMNYCAHGIVGLLIMKGLDVEPDEITPELLVEYDIQDVIGISNVVKRYY